MTLLPRLAAGLEGAAVIDSVSSKVNAVVLKVAKPGRARDLASGRALGHPAHPALVALPIGAWSSALLFDALGQAEPARTLIGLGLVSALPTVVTGASDWADTTGAEQRVGFVHLLANSAAITCYAVSWWTRRRHRGTGVAWALAGAGLTGAAGWLGGHLAYALGVGVDTNAFEGGPTEWTAARGAPPTSPQPVSLEAGGVALVASKVGGTARVLADRCSHRGGPLSDGEVEEGCVTCPWHGSRFDLATGEVRRGPATVPQPAYQVRQSTEGLEVRRDEPRTLRVNSVRGR